MGLALRVDGNTYAEWSYSGYGEFRKKIATQVGIDLYQMDGFHNVDKSVLPIRFFSTWDRTAKDWEAYREAIEADLSQEKISWDTVDDPIKILLNHSDCEGQIPADQCEVLADRLEEIIKDWPERLRLKTDPFWQDRGYPAEMNLNDHDTTHARGLVAGLREAAKIGKPLEFF
jgi:hypothetical protein